MKIKERLTLIKWRIINSDNVRYFHLSKWPDEIIREQDDEIERLQKQLSEANKVIDSKQAKIDALMLEYCPDEMTYEQMQEWEDSQRIVGHPPFIEDDREYWLEPIDYIKWRDYTYFLTNCLDLGEQQ